MTCKPILLVLLAFVLAGCTAIETEIQRVLENTEDRAAQEQGIHTVRLARWTDDVPAGTLLQLDVANDYQVFLSHDAALQPLGKLTQQLPNAPVQTMLIDTGADRFIVGWIDEAVAGDLNVLSLGRYVSPTAQRPYGQTAKLWQVDPGSRMFFIPILAAEQSQWSQLAYIYANPEESARASVASNEFNPVFWVEYAPPLDLEPLFQQVTVDLEP